MFSQKEESQLIFCTDWSRFRFGLLNFNDFLEIISLRVSSISLRVPETW